MNTTEIIKKARSLDEKEQTYLIGALLKIRAEKDTKRRKKWAAQLDDPDKSRWIEINEAKKLLGLT